MNWAQRRRDRAREGGGVQVQRSRQTADRRARRFTAAAILVGAILGTAMLLDVACGNGSSANPVPPSSESIMAGAILFEVNCRLCHGQDGRGSDLAADLTVHVPTRGEQFLFGRISEGFDGGAQLNSMPAFKSILTERERWHLVNFLQDAFGQVSPVLPETRSRY